MHTRLCRKEMCIRDRDMPSGDRNPEWQNRKYFEGTEKKRSAVSEACYRKEWKEITIPAKSVYNSSFFINKCTKVLLLRESVL